MDETLPPTLPERGATSRGELGTLGRYRVTGRLGAGGMGEVLSVLDPEVGREIAAKVVRGHVDASALQKFLLEGRITGQLEHPNIIPLHELGRTADGRQYFTMKRVQGQTLEALLDEADGLPKARSWYRFLAIFLKVCDAVAYAHSRGVIHRDLKPANVMVGEFGEVLVLDWGLAKIIGEPDLAAGAVTIDRTGDHELAPLATLAGSVVGTPAYMPPEQAEGRIESLDGTSDVYALGAILYRILAGAPPYEAATPWGVLAQVHDGELVPPSRRAPERDVPWELEAVVLQAMRRDQAARYPTAAALAADVQAFLDGGILGAARYSLAQRAAKWAGRHRALVGAAAAVVVVALGLAFAFRHQALRARAEERRLARDEARRALEHAPTLAQLRAALTADASAVEPAAAVGLGPYLRAMSALDRALAVEPSAELRRDRRWLTESLALAATLGGDFSLARTIGETLADYDAAPDEVRAVLAVVERRRAAAAQARERADATRLASRRDRIREILAAIGRTAGALANWELDDHVYELVAYRDAQTVALLGEALAPLVTKAAELGRSVHWTEAEVASARLACRVLGRIHRDEAVPHLAAWMAVVWDEALVVEAGHALCHTRNEDAYAPLVAAMERLGPNAHAWREIQHLFHLVPEPRAVARTAPDTARAYSARGTARLMHGDVAGALTDFDRAIELDAGFADAYANRGSLRHTNRDYAGAIADFTRAIELEPTRLSAYLNLGTARYLSGDHSGARAVLDRLLRMDPRCAPAYDDRGLVRVAQGDLDGAIADFTRAIELDPKAPSPYNHRGTTRRERGDLDGAIVDLTEAIALDPTEPISYYNRGLAHQSRGDFARAIADYTFVLGLDPRHVAAYNNRGNARHQAGDTEGAIADLTQAIDLEPGNPQTYNNRGLVHKTRREHAAAIADFTRAVELDPSYVGAYNNRASASLAARDLAASLADYDRVIALIPDDAAAYNNRGFLRLELREVEGALVDLARAVELAPGRWQGHYGLGMALARHGRRAEAIPHLRRAVELAPADKRDGVAADLARVEQGR